MLAPLITITRRDVRDSLSDWRTIIPLGILSILLPYLILVGVRFATRTILFEAELVQVLVPFGLLLAGFVPASFSLIGPLESFVGERERNTLESLLSAPISDRSLYLGKFIAALMPPLGSSMVAMLVYTLAARSSWRDDIVAAMTFNWFIVIMLIVAIKAITMVAAAVYISATATSIRSANLLASFILIPMTGVVQAEALLFVRNNLGPVALISGALTVVAIGFLLLGMKSFNREEVLAREHKPIRNRGGALRGTLSTRRYGATITVARREIRDTLSDWRILTPLLLLTVLVPILAIFIIGRIEPRDSVVPLMPFILLLVGFLPTSFSLITALEVFVGEKERGSLESLFSMPISDRQLYFGKFLSAMLPPVGSGLLAMVLFTAGLWMTGTHDMLSGLTPTIFAGMLGLSIIQALTMVAGAVIISSHTSTVRVANLLASFVLLPVTIVAQLEALLVIAKRWDAINVIAMVMSLTGVILLRAGLQSFNRESILSREHLALNWSSVIGAFFAFFREIRPAGVDPDRLAPNLSIRRFYRDELPVVWREVRMPLVFVLVSVVATVIFASVFDPQGQMEVSGFIGVQNIGLVPQIDNQAELIAQIFLRNIRAAFFAGLFSVISFGLVAWLVPMIAFYAIAYAAAWAERYDLPGGAGSFLLAYVLPHCVVELPTAILVAALGLRVGASAISVRPSYSVGRHMSWAVAMYLKVFLFVLVPLFLLGAMIEGTITPMVARSVYLN